MSVSNTDNQQNSLKKSIGKLFIQTQPYLEKGFCPTKDLLATSLDKWSIFVIFNLGYYNTLRFSELEKNISNISARMLSVTLKKLEERKVINREVFAEVPLRVEYSLTPFGKALSQKVADLSNWFIEESEFLKEKMKSIEPTP